MLTKSDFARWKSDPITKEIYKLLEEYQQESKVRLLGIDTLDPNSLLRINRLKGYIEGVQDVLNLEVTEDEIDEESGESTGI